MKAFVLMSPVFGEAFNKLCGLSIKKIGPSNFVALRKTMKVVSEQTEVIIAAQKNLVETYAAKDAEGKPIILRSLPDGSTEYDVKDNLEEVGKLRVDLFNTEIELPALDLKLTVLLENAADDLTTKDLNTLVEAGLVKEE